MKPQKAKKTPENQRRIPQQARARAKVEAVLDACTQLLVRNGFHQTSVLELSLESGVPVPSLYQYFENKEAIFVAWVERSIDQILLQVIGEQGNLKGATLARYTDGLVRVALVAVAHLRPSLRRLLTDVPHLLSNQIIVAVEDKTVAMIESQFAEEVSTIAVSDIHFKLRMLVRLITGYFLQAVLNDVRILDVEKESAELAILIKLYLLSEDGINASV